MPLIKCSYPVKTTGAQLVSDALKAILAGLRPEPLPPETPHHITTYVSDANARQLAETGTPLAEAIPALAYATHQQRLREQRAKPAPLGETEDDRNRAYLLSEAIAGLDAGQITLGEASTGLGKSRILARSAAHLLAKNPRFIIYVAAPTLAILRHLLDEFAKTDAALHPALLLGQQHFLSRRRVLATIADLKAEGDAEIGAFEPLIEAWLADGAPPRMNHTRELAAHIHGLSHLLDDLVDLAPVLSRSLCELSSRDDDEPAAKLLATLERRAESSRLVFLTHAMLVRRVRFLSSDAELPFTHLLMDEAHQFENIAAEQQSSELSFLSLRAYLRAQGFTNSQAAMDNITHLMKKLARLAEAGSLETGFAVPTDTKDEIRRTLNHAHGIIQRARRGDPTERAEILGRIKAVVTTKDYQFGISFSPLRRYPSIYAGPQSIAPMLGAIWKRTQAALLLSATLFTPKQGAGFSCNYSQAKLSIPTARARQVGPIVSSWVTTTPLLLLPETAAAERLSYPKDEERDDDGAPTSRTKQYATWLDATAEVIAQAAASAFGGTLVLCTAYKDIEGLRARLTLSLADRLIAAGRKGEFHSQQTEFIESARAGRRPLWLATGAAWTGLDLRDKLAASPDADNLLTDLVILRAPLRLNNSSTHITRRIRLGFSVELNEAAIHLKQGIGRLMRSSGVQHRRLWVLDGRLVLPRKIQFHGLNRIFANYTRRERFTLKTTA